MPLTEPAEQAAAAVLRERAQRLAQPIAARVERGVGLEVLCFGLGRERYAIETRYVCGTRRACPVTPLPMAGDHVLGVTNIQGDLLVVFDLRAVFGIERVRSSDAPHFLIFGVEQAEFAVDVDSLDKVTELDSARLLEPTLTVPGGSRGSRAYLRGVTHEALLLLDGDALLADERLFVDAP
ncbi:MAG: hypothetical protein RL701_5532 [Pseudomonadota bacterium]|jgi:purine-binding chemotaxis protein CheW